MTSCLAPHTCRGVCVSALAKWCLRETPVLGRAGPQVFADLQAGTWDNSPWQGSLGDTSPCQGLSATSGRNVARAGADQESVQGGAAGVTV